MLLAVAAVGGSLGVEAAVGLWRRVNGCLTFLFLLAQTFAAEFAHGFGLILYAVIRLGPAVEVMAADAAFHIAAGHGIPDAPDIAGKLAAFRVVHRLSSPVLVI